MSLVDRFASSTREFSSRFEAIREPSDGILACGGDSVEVADIEGSVIKCIVVYDVFVLLSLVTLTAEL